MIAGIRTPTPVYYLSLVFITHNYKYACRGGTQGSLNSNLDLHVIPLLPAFKIIQ